MTGGATLIQGQSLRLPAGVVKSSHNASTFKTYDPGEINGDLSPTTIRPQNNAAGKKGCGGFGAILLVVVAVVVTVVTAGAAAGALGLVGTGVGGAAGAIGGIGLAFSGGLGAAGLGLGSLGLAGVAIGAGAAAVGSIVSQAVGVATGIQEKFSWNAVALAAIGGGVGVGLGGATGTFGKALENGLVRGATSSVISQGIGIATGLQDEFSWVSVAASAAGSFVGDAIGAGFGANANFGEKLVISGASALANAATRSALDGSNFGDNIIAAIPDVIGSAIGNAIVDGMGGVKAAPGEKGFNWDRAKGSAKAQLQTSVLHTALLGGDTAMYGISLFLEVKKALGGSKDVIFNKNAEGNEINADGTPLSTKQLSVRAAIAKQSSDPEMNAQVAPNEAAYIVGETEKVYPGLTGEAKRAFEMGLINTDVYLDETVDGFLPSGIKRLDNDDPRVLGMGGIELINDDSGYYAAVYEIGDGELVYVNRGSGSRPWDTQDWVQNFKQGIGLETAQYNIAMDNALSIQASGTNVTFSGHSLGGGLAQAQAYATGGKAFVFDASGVHNETMARRLDIDIANSKAEISAYHAKGEVVTKLQQVTSPRLNSWSLGVIPPTPGVRGGSLELPVGILTDQKYSSADLHGMRHIIAGIPAYTGWGN